MKILEKVKLEYPFLFIEQTCQTCGKKFFFNSTQIINKYNTLSKKRKIVIGCCRSHNNIIRNKLFGSPFSSKTNILKAIKTKINNIDKNGLNSYQRQVIKCKQTRLSRYGDKNYNNKYKAKQTALSNIDKSGLNSYQRRIILNQKIKFKRYGNKNYNNSKKGHQTKLNNIDSNGLNSCQRQVIKCKNTRFNDIDKNGLNSYQRGTLKGRQTKLIKYGNKSYNNRNKFLQTILNNVDSNGLNSCQRQVIKCKNTRLNDIDKNGLNSYQRSMIKNKQTCLNKYKVNSYSKTQQFKNTIKEKHISIQQKRYQTMKKNNTLNSSKIEDKCFKLLKTKFLNIIRQFKSNLYPFNCDFYIPCKDLYIECNFHWTHGKESFNKNNLLHLEQLEKWKSKNTKFYNNAIEVWTIRDPLKLECFKKNHLNYKIFYNENEFNDWFYKI